MRKTFIFKDKYNNYTSKGESVVYKLPGMNCESVGVVSRSVKSLSGQLIEIYDKKHHKKPIKLFPHELVLFGPCDRLIPCSMSFHDLIDWLNDIDYNKLS